MAKDKTASDVSKLIKDNNVKLIDFKFTDLLGTWQHFTTTLSEYHDEVFTDGLAGNGEAIQMEQVAQLEHHGWHATRVPQVFDRVPTGRLGIGRFVGSYPF